MSLPRTFILLIELSESSPNMFTIMTQCYVYYYDTMLCLRVQVLYLRVVGTQLCNVALDNVRRQNIYALYRFQLTPCMDVMPGWDHYDTQ